MTAKDLQLIQEYAPHVNEVLTQADLKTLFSGQSEAALYKKLTSFISEKPELYFGFEPQNGVLRATPEKALLDVCYFMLKGRTFSFDPAEDVSLERLDLGRVRDYLETYDQRFRNWLVKTWRL